ncbi:MAG: S41 family peptidase [Gemmatimonadota bacterium]
MTPNPRFRRGRVAAASHAAGVALLLTTTACTRSFFKLDPDGGPVATPAAVAVAPAADTPAAALPPLMVGPEPAAGASDSAGVARLAALARVWHTIALHHPSLGDSPQAREAWDGATAGRLPAVRDAGSTGALREAYSGLLGMLQDPLTRVESDTFTDGSDDASAGAPRYGATRVSTLGDGTLLIMLPPTGEYRPADREALATAVRTLRDGATRVVLDLRGTSTRGVNTEASTVADGRTASDAVDAFLEGTGLPAALVSSRLPMPSVRVRRIGAQGTVGATLDGTGPLIVASQVMAGWHQEDARAILPTTGALSPGALSPGAAPRSDARAAQIVVIANPASIIPRAVAALVAAGRAKLVGEGQVTDESLVPTVRVPLAPGLFVRVRAGELVAPDGTRGFRVDTVVAMPAAAGDSAPALRAALRMVRTASAPAPGTRPGRPGAGMPVFPQGSIALAGDTLPYPYMGARVLAGMRLWSVMRAGHAHRDSYDDDIDAALERSIPALERATNREQYAAALLDLAASFDDSQVRLGGTAVDALRGAARLPMRVRLIEGRAIVTAVSGAAVSGSTPVSVGTEITSIEGFPLSGWMRDRRRQVSASNEWTRGRDLMDRLARGPAGSALLRVRDATGPERAAPVSRIADAVPGSVDGAVNGDAAPPERTTAAVSRPSSDVVYIDADRLDEGAAAAAITGAADARALIVDLRGSAKAWRTLLRRLSVQPEYPVARVVQRVTSMPCIVTASRDAQRLCPDERVSQPVVVRVDTAAHFRGRLVVLIDERTQGEAEQLAAALESGAGATLIGSSSAGAAADTVTMRLPGGLTLSYPVDEIRRADGSQLHRTGLTPMVEVRETVRGFRAGRDDVLERAREWLQQGDTTRRRR